MRQPFATCLVILLALTSAFPSSLPSPPGLPSPSGPPSLPGPPGPPPAWAAGLPPSVGWRWPLSPRPVVARGFEPPDSPWGPGHRGVDLLAAADQPVLAAGPGTVTFAGILAGRGVVAINHGRVRTTYEPVKPTVHLGDHLEAGDPLGVLQRAATHCAPRTCLHWGALRDTTYIDPLHLLTTTRPRLLPLDTPPPTADGLPSRNVADAPPVPATMALTVTFTTLAVTAVSTAATTAAAATHPPSAGDLATTATPPPATADQPAHTATAALRPSHHPPPTADQPCHPTNHGSKPARPYAHLPPGSATTSPPRADHPPRPPLPPPLPLPPPIHPQPTTSPPPPPQPAATANPPAHIARRGLPSPPTVDHPATVAPANRDSRPVRPLAYRPPLPSRHPPPTADDLGAPLPHQPPLPHHAAAVPALMPPAATAAAPGTLATAAASTTTANAALPTKCHHICCHRIQAGLRRRRRRQAGGS